MIAVLLILLVTALAFANGANDVSRGVATLVGSGLAGYRRALAWGTFWTVAGALAAGAVMWGLVDTFSTGLLTAPPERPDVFAIAVAGGACAWVLMATRTGLPVSTTHAMTGAIVGAAVAAGGWGLVQWPLLMAAVVLPLVLSPLVSAAAAWGLHGAAAPPLGRASRYCVCLESRPQLAFVPVPAVGPVRFAPPSVPSGILVGSEAACETPVVTGRVRLTDAAHWASSAALSFARGLNDAPKIVGLAAGLAVAAGGSAGWLFGVGALAMGTGSYVAGRRVTRTLGERVTDLDPLEGLSANAVASTMVLGASVFALPVSTTHVSSGAIVGAGLRGGVGAVRWGTVSSFLLAWLVTVPMTAALGAVLWVLFSR